LIPTKESLSVEFKSDRKRLPDRELVEAVVCLANTDGGAIYLGVEDDGQPTGLHPKHTNSQGLPALIANRTTPSMAVIVTPMKQGGYTILRIQVQQSRQIVSTTDGVINAAGCARMASRSVFRFCLTNLLRDRLVPRHRDFGMFRTPVRFKHKASRPQA
jgi:predicted HTH transcriptional regulator